MSEFSGISQEEYSLVQKAAEKYHLSVTDEQIENETEQLWLEWVCCRTYENLAGKPVMFLSNEEKNKITGELREEALVGLLTKKVLTFIIQQEDISVSDREKRREAERMAQRQQMKFDEVTEFLGKDLGLLENDLKYRKALAWLKEQETQNQNQEGVQNG